MTGKASKAAVAAPGSGSVSGRHGDIGVSRAVQSALLQAAIEAGRRGDGHTVTVIVRGLLAAVRDDRDLLLGACFALIVGGRYRMAVRLLRLALARSVEPDDFAARLLVWALEVSAQPRAAARDARASDSPPQTESEDYDHG